MSKIGILTFHYSNNYGGVLQSLALHNTVKELGYDVEIINYIPKSYQPYNLTRNLGISKNIFKNKLSNLNVINISQKVKIMNKYSKSIMNKFDSYREEKANYSKRVDEDSLETILNNYSAIIVGSDQVWNPSQRRNPIYFLNFGDKYKGKKISYAPDSTIRDVNPEDLQVLKKALGEFHHISVRNDHSFDFVKSVIDKEAEIVADPTLLFDFNNLGKKESSEGEYILTYVLGKEIDGSHGKVIEKIRSKYGNLPVYSIKIPTMNFDLSPFADKVFYDLNPEEWMSMFKNAKFVYTDSFHGVLFSLKYHKPFLAYYTEKLRATRFIDLGKRYNIDKYIVQNKAEIDEKQALDVAPDFNSIDKIIESQKKTSLDFLRNALYE